MESKLKVPKFKTETEEADWWYEHRDLVSKEFARADAEGTLGRGTAMKRAQQAAANAGSAIQIDASDMKKAQAVASRKGIDYQTYVRSLIHQALEQEADVA